MGLGTLIRCINKGKILDVLLMLFLLEGFVLFIGDVLVEFGGSAFTFRDEVEADTTDVLLGTEILEIVDLLALDF